MFVTNIPPHSECQYAGLLESSKRCKSMLARVLKALSLCSAQIYRPAQAIARQAAGSPDLWPASRQKPLKLGHGMHYGIRSFHHEMLCDDRIAKNGKAGRRPALAGHWRGGRDLHDAAHHVRRCMMPGTDTSSGFGKARPQDKLAPCQSRLSTQAQCALIASVIKRHMLQCSDCWHSATKTRHACTNISESNIWCATVCNLHVMESMTTTAT